MAKKKKLINRAKPVIRASRQNDAERIHVARTTVTQMSQSPEWPNAPGVQAATATWLQAADALEANQKVVSDLRKKLEAAMADQLSHRRDYEAAAQHVVANVALHARGSADTVSGFGLGVRTQSPAGPLGVPTDLATAPGKERGEVTFTWKRGSARHGFNVQHAVDPADPVKVVGPLPCTKARFTVIGMQPSVTVYFRVAAVDPTTPAGLGPWTEWVAGTAR